MVSWGTIQTLLVFFGPWLLPRALAWFRSLKNRPTAKIRPLPVRCSYGLALLFAFAILAFLSTLPFFAPDNIFIQTQSRLHTSAGVLFTRLAALRSMTPADDRLRRVFDEGGVDARLLYALYGPSVVADCPLAKPRDADAGRMFLIYALPSILIPHVLHVLALGIVTSDSLSGADGAKWRRGAVIAGLVLATVEVWFTATYDNSTNARSTRLNEVDFSYWKVRVWRGLGIAGVDTVLGWLIWLQATGRAFVSPLTPAERVGEQILTLEALVNQTRNIGVIRNAVVRDASARNRVHDYWVKEGEVMKDVLEEPEVLQAQRIALKRFDSVKVGREADTYLDSLFGGLDVTPR